MSEEKNLNEIIEEEEFETITLIDDNGEEKEFMIDDEFDFEDKHYLVLCEDEESEDAYLFYVEEDGEDNLVLKEVDNDEEFDKVSEFYFNC